MRRGMRNCAPRYRVKTTTSSAKHGYVWLARLASQSDTREYTKLPRYELHLTLGYMQQGPFTSTSDIIEYGDYQMEVGSLP